MVTTIQHHIEHHVTRLTTLWFHRCYGQGPHTSEDREHHREHSSSFLVRRNGVTGDAKQLSACLNKVRTDSKVSMFSYVFGGPKYNPPKLTGGFLWRSSMMITYSCCRCCLGPRPRWKETGPTSKRTVLPNLNMLQWEWWFIYPIIEVVFCQPSHCQLRLVDDEVLHLCSLWGGCSTLATPFDIFWGRGGSPQAAG